MSWLDQCLSSLYLKALTVSVSTSPHHLVNYSRYWLLDHNMIITLLLVLLLPTEAQIRWRAISHNRATSIFDNISRLHDTNRIYNRLYRVNKHPIGCQTVTGLTTLLPLFVQPGWTNSHCSFNRLSNRVVQTVWQPAVYTIQPVVYPVCIV